MQGYSGIAGHADIKIELRETVSSGRIGHAYIFEGEDASGRAGLAKAFAASLLCEAGGPEACGDCPSCRRSLSGNSPDLTEVAPDPDKKNAGIGVEEIRRRIVDDASVRPFFGGRKVYLVLEAQKMTAQAQNALLKTLEEPPANVVIILVCDDADHLLETVRSRCRVISCGALAEATIKKTLLRNGMADEHTAGLCAALSGGDLQAAEAYASSEVFLHISYEAMAALKDLSGLSMRRMHDMLDMVKDASAADLMLRIMKIWFRDVLLFKATAEVNSISFSGELRSIRRCAARNDYLDLEKALHDVDKARVRLDANVNQELTMELLLLSLRETIK